MKLCNLSVLDDERYPQGGHVRARFVGAASTTVVAALQVCVRRGAAVDPWLGPTGWQASPHEFAVLEQVQDGQDLCLLLGPTVVDPIEEFTVVEISIPALDIAGRASWTGVTSSHEGAQLAPSVAATRSPPPPNPPPVRPVAPPPSDPPAPSPAPVPQNPPVVDVPPPRPRVLDPQPPAPPSRTGWWVLLVLLLIGGVAAAGWWWRQNQDPAIEPAPVEPRPTENAPRPAPRPLTPPEPSSPAPTPPVPASPRTAAQWHEDGVQRYRAGDVEGARTALRQAAAQDHGPTLLFLGELLDSVDFQAGYFTQPNDIAAMEYFAKACQQGTPAAAQALTTLGEALRTRAAQGDAMADIALRVNFEEAQQLCR